MFQMPCPQSPLEGTCGVLMLMFYVVCVFLSLRWFRPDDGETHHDRSLLFIWLLYFTLCLGLYIFYCHARTCYTWNTM
jgi:hypothetical protein